MSVLVPWRPDGGHRDAAWAYLRDRWAREHPGWQIVEGRAPDGAWCKAAAVGSALARADGQLLVVADADVWTDGVAEAVEQVAAGAPWAIPHWHVNRLTPDATARVLAGGRLEGDIGKSRSLRWERLPYPGFPGGGMTVLTRELYVESPMDPRLLGWGQEDECWALALHTLAGAPWRGPDDLWHFYHPPQPRRSARWGSEESRRLYVAYRIASRNPAAMCELLAGASCRGGMAR
ncbi:hypothetical protein [Actinomadura nitritigenes]|uniref:hypothetical protein n=1 Tax=Actinomadura nitritigenes TaxID=134602 RepID=UPI003D8B318E